MTCRCTCAPVEENALGYLGYLAYALSSARGYMRVAECFESVTLMREFLGLCFRSNISGRVTFSARSTAGKS